MRLKVFCKIWIAKNIVSSLQNVPANKITFIKNINNVFFIFIFYKKPVYKKPNTRGPKNVTTFN